MVSTTRPAPAPAAGGDRPAARARPHGPPFDATVAFLAASAYLAMLAWGMANLSFDIWGAMVVGPVLVAISAPLLAAAIRREADPRMAKTGARGSMTPRTWPIGRRATRPFSTAGSWSDSATDTPRRTTPLRVAAAAQSATAEHSSPRLQPHSPG